MSQGVRDVVDAAAIPHIDIGTLSALGNPHLSVGESRGERLVSRRHGRIAFAYTGIPRWRPLGEYWLEGVKSAARARDRRG